MLAGRAPCRARVFQVRCIARLQGRSSVVEQRPFKPKVVGSIPTAPTNFLAEKGLATQQVNKKSRSRTIWLIDR
jgi:hypothetical protein